MSDTWELRRLSDKAVMVRLNNQPGVQFTWSPPAHAFPTGKLQWYYRKSGGKRFFKRGPVVSYER